MAEKDRRVHLERLLFLSDGILAIAMTLLAIDLKIPEGLGGQEVRDAIAGLGTDLGHYFLSFYILARYWMGHVARFNRIQAIDLTFVNLSLFSLCMIALVPAGTALISDYPTDRAAFSVYMALMGLLGTSDFLAWRHLTRQEGSIDIDKNEREQRSWLRFRLTLPLVAFAALAVGWYKPELGLGIFVACVVGMDIIHQLRFKGSGAGKVLS